jgi:hypothetical protein
LLTNKENKKNKKNKKKEYEKTAQKHNGRCARLLARDHKKQRKNIMVAARACSRATIIKKGIRKNSAKT